jgi:hypothetical protein
MRVCSNVKKKKNNQQLHIIVGTMSLCVILLIQDSSCSIYVVIKS